MALISIRGFFLGVSLGWAIRAEAGGGEATGTRRRSGDSGRTSHLLPASRSPHLQTTPPDTPNTLPAGSTLTQIAIGACLDSSLHPRSPTAVEVIFFFFFFIVTLQKKKGGKIYITGSWLFHHF